MAWYTRSDMPNSLGSTVAVVKVSSVTTAPPVESGRSCALCASPPGGDAFLVSVEGPEPVPGRDRRLLRRPQHGGPQGGQFGLGHLQPAHRLGQLVRVDTVPRHIQADIDRRVDGLHRHRRLERTAQSHTPNTTSRV